MGDAASIRDIIFTPNDIGTKGREYIEYRRDNQHTGLPFGIHKVDGCMLPVLDGEIVAILGRPGNGKTGVMMHWARHRAQSLKRIGSNRVVLYLTYEQTIEDLEMFNLARELKLDIANMAVGRLDDEQLQSIRAQYDKRVQLPLWFLGHSAMVYKQRPTITVDDIDAALAEINGWDGLNNGDTFSVDSVFVDYLQRMPYKRFESKTVGVSDNIDALKNIALKHRCKVVVGVQARRDVDMSKDKVPQLDDGQWTSNIEQAADKVLSVMRPSKYFNDGETLGSVTVRGQQQLLLSLLKQKLAPDGHSIWLYFAPEYNYLDELETREATNTY